MGFFDLFKRKDKKKKEKYKMGLHKTREGALSTLKDILSKSNKIDEDLFDELEEIFIMADIGVDTVIDFIDKLKSEVKTKGITNPVDLQEMIMDEMFEIYLNGEIVNANLNLKKEGLSVVLFVGVNGVGKTTSIAKIAYQYKKMGKKVLLAAGDTFRAGAVAQLDVWANRVGVDIVVKPDGSDPSAVMFDAVKKAKTEGYDLLLCDTAGRLQNKVNLMNELAKMKRVIQKEIPDAPHETLLVIDATTGQNGMSQAKAFKEATDVSGVILTKLDGTSKGGIVLGIRHELGIPIKYIGKIELSVNAGTLNITDIENEHIEANGQISEVTLQGNKSEIEIDSNLDMQISVLSHEGAIEINQLSATSRLTLPADYRFRSAKKGIATHIYYERQGKKVDDFSDTEADNYIEFNGIKSELVIAEAEV